MEVAADFIGPRKFSRDGADEVEGRRVLLEVQKRG
jgi:hypothetical protein